MTQAWESVRLGQVLKQVSRGESVQATKEYKLLGVRLDAGGAFHRETKLGSESSANTLYQVREGDFIYSRLFAWRGAFDLISQELDGCFVSNEFPIFHARDELIDLHFLNFWFQLSSTLKAVEADCTGSTPLTRNRFKESFFLALQIPLPPLEEQRRIVARVESLAAQIAEARGLREEANEKREFLDHRIAARVFDNPFWEKKSVGELCEVRSGIQKSANRLPGANPRRYITVAHVQRNRIDTTDPRYFEVNTEEFERWKLISGDVLVIEGNGSRDHIGRAALFSGQIEDCVHQNHVIRVRPNQKEIQPEFLNAYFNSPVGREQMLERSRTSSGLYTLSTGRIREIIVPLPNLEQQNEAIGILEGYKSQISALEQLQEATRLELEALLPSVLSKAFAGEL